jgi:ammonium transporter Rh
MFASIGALFCWVFFPFLNIDIPISLVYNYSAAINTFYSISACVMTSVSLSCIINGKLDLKHIVFSPVVGGVAIGSSAAFISNTFDSMLVGVGAAVLLVCLLGLDRQIRWKVVVENYGLYLYGIVGAAGGLVSAIFTEESKDERKFASLPLGFVLQSASNQLIGVGISAGIGICGGILVGLLLCLVSV